MEVYKFMNSAPGDPRTYQAADFADYFGSVLSTGLLHTDNVPGMSVSVEAGTLNTVVSAGKAIMKGHLYENTAPLTLAHSLPEPTLDRIDRVVLRLDLRNAERNIKLHVKEGVASATPVAPTLQRDNVIYEISLARVLVRKNTVQLLQSDLVDERLDESLAGLVHSLISIPTSQFQAEWDAFMAGIEDSGFASTESVTAVSDALTTHKAEDAIDAHNATSISVADANNRFTGNNVETVLDELFTFANNGKTDIASVIGSPATVGDTFTQLKTHIQTSKNDLATNLSAKGQSSVGTEPLDALVDKVALVNTGKKSASGSGTSNSSGVVSVTGLAFTPNKISVKIGPKAVFYDRTISASSHVIIDVVTGTAGGAVNNGLTISNSGVTTSFSFGSTGLGNTAFTYQAVE